MLIVITSDDIGLGRDEDIIIIVNRIGVVFFSLLDLGVITGSDLSLSETLVVLNWNKIINPIWRFTDFVGFMG